MEDFDAQRIIRAQMIQTLMREQGMSQEEAAAYADSKMQEAAMASEAAANPDEIMADNPLGSPWPDIPTPGLPNMEATAPSQQASAPVGTGTPQGQEAASSPSSPAMPESPSIFDNPEAVNAVLSMGDRNRQMEYAEGLRSMETPGGRYVSNGRVYVASNPLEHIAKGVGAYKGTKDIKRLEGEQTDAKKAIIDALRTKKPEEEKDKLAAMLGSIPV